MPDKQKLKDKLMSDMDAKGIDISMIMKKPASEPTDDMPQVDLLSHLEDMKPMLMGATSEEKLDFLYAFLEACQESKEMPIDEPSDEIVDGADIPELPVAL